MNLDESYKFCRKRAFGHYENFPVASLLLPQPQRNAIAAVYAFARQADDYADEKEFAHDRLGLLDKWQDNLGNDSDDPVFIALRDSIARFQMPKELLIGLISAFKQDVTKARYKDFAEVLDYCRRSANPVGRLVLRVFNKDTTEAVAESDAICSALQLANFWQDLGSDIRDRDRVYLPQDELDRFSVAIDALKRGEFSAAVADLMRFQIDRTEDMFMKGRGLAGRLGGRLGLEIRLTVLGGLEILNKIRKQGYNTLIQRPALKKRDWLKLLFKAGMKIGI